MCGSLALRRNVAVAEPAVLTLKDALLGRELIVTTGIVLQEQLQGFSASKAKAEIIHRFTTLPLVQPDRSDHIEAAEIRNSCRRAGIQLGTVDALIAQPYIRHELQLLTTDKDFTHAAAHCSLKLWADISDVAKS